MVENQHIADGTLDAWEEIARRDDWHLRLVASDIRMLIGDLRRARHRLASSAPEVDRLREALQSLTDAADECANTVNTSMMDDAILAARQALAQEGGQ